MSREVFVEIGLHDHYEHLRRDAARQRDQEWLRRKQDADRSSRRNVSMKVR